MKYLCTSQQVHITKHEKELGREDDVSDRCVEGPVSVNTTVASCAGN